MFGLSSWWWAVLLRMYHFIRKLLSLLRFNSHLLMYKFSPHMPVYWAGELFHIAIIVLKVVVSSFYFLHRNKKIWIQFINRFEIFKWNFFWRKKLGIPLVFLHIFSYQIFKFIQSYISFNWNENFILIWK